MARNPGNSVMADPESAAKVYTLAAGKIEAAAQDPTRVPAGQLKVYRDVLRATAKHSFENFAKSENPPPATLWPALDSILAGGASTAAAFTTASPLMEQAANTLAGTMLEVPQGGFNAAAQWLRSMAMAKRGRQI
jgi:hypothetical protein